MEALHPGIILTPDFVPFLTAMISPGWSKFAFLNAGGVFFFLRKGEFTERGGLFLSNLTWEQTNEGWTGRNGYTYVTSADPTDPRGFFIFRHKSYIHKKADRYHWECTACEEGCYMESDEIPGWCPTEGCKHDEESVKKMAVTPTLPEID